jgi:Domain of unknown function (DUF4150)
MADNLGARQQSGWTIYSIPPDVCKTPMGSSIVPIPYPVTSKLEDAFGVVRTVRLNGHPAVVFDQSKTPETKGDSQGKATGIKSNTVGMKCEPIDKSSTVRAGKKWVVRHLDKFWMNGA